MVRVVLNRLRSTSRDSTTLTQSGLMIVTLRILAVLFAISLTSPGSLWAQTIQTPDPEAPSAAPAPIPSRPLYPSATGLAVGGWLRLSANKHHLSDVLLGAGIGIAAGPTVSVGSGRATFDIGFQPTPGGAALTFTKR
jgi:hypothetical protein